MIQRTMLILLLCGATTAAAGDDDVTWNKLKPFFEPPAEFAGQFGAYHSPLKFYDGTPAKDGSDWLRRRQEILDRWNGLLGKWPELIEHPQIERLESMHRDNFTQHRIRVEVARGQILDGYLLVPDGTGPFPAVVVPFYEPETSIGTKGERRDFALQLSRRGFVSIAIGSPGGDARKPDVAGTRLQPLSYLGYVAANCHNALAALPEVDAKRIGIVGHSYGGKWAMFGSCLYDKFACAAWSDPGIVFDETRGSVNYWEPWYLGLGDGPNRKPGLITPDNPRTGPYATLIDEGLDLHELHALMAPRPFLVSGGSEDFPARWIPLNHSVAVNNLLGATHRVGMTNRPKHDPTVESNEMIYAFFEHFLKPQKE